jgi:hypothetical protein
MSRIKRIGLPLLFIGYSSIILSQQTVSDPVKTRLQHIRVEYQKSLDFLEARIGQHDTADQHRVQTSRMTFGRPTVCLAEINEILRPRVALDERMPSEVEVKRAMAQCRKERDLALSSTPVVNSQ